jgi:hypothetical protein
VFFRAPAGIALQLQTLDKNGMAILTEKSFFYLQPGENRSCVGCHEPAGTAPLAMAPAGAAQREPAILDPPAGPGAPWGMSFKRNVQPVLDRYCISCHGLDRKAGDVNLVTDPGIYPANMKELIRRGEHWVGLKARMWDRDEQYNISRPMRFFAYSNKVAHMLVGNVEKSSPELVEIHHDKLHMDRNSLMRIIEWLDLNAQACSDLFPNKPEERRIDEGALNALREFAKNVLGEKVAAQPALALVNPVAPAESRILKAPMPVAYGGWGQIQGFSDTDDPKFIRMTELVEACIVRKENENTRGWEPTLEMGAGDPWFVEARQAFRNKLGKNADNTGKPDAGIP